MENHPAFDFTLDGVVVSLEASQLTYNQALEMLLKAYPERKLDIYRGLRAAVVPEPPKAA